MRLSGQAFLPVPVLSPSTSSRQTRMSVLLISFCFRFRSHRYRQRKQIDETFRVFRVVAAHGEPGQVGAVERKRRNAFPAVERALPESQAHGAGNALLRHSKKSIEA